MRRRRRSNEPGVGLGVAVPNSPAASAITIHSVQQADHQSAQPAARAWNIVNVADEFRLTVIAAATMAEVFGPPWRWRRLDRARAGNSCR
jgi:hypothetical protein